MERLQKGAVKLEGLHKDMLEGQLGPSISGDRAAMVPIEVALSKRLQQIIDDTEGEFNRLGPCVGPLARHSFEAKTGQTMAESRDTATTLSAVLEDIRSSDDMAEALLRANYPRVRDWLGNLIAYYHQAPAEIPSLSQDARVVSDVAFYSPQRETSLRFLLRGLERLAKANQP